MTAAPANIAKSTTTFEPRPPVLHIRPPSRWWTIPFGELWTCRELLYFFVWRDIKVRYKQTVIGAAWAILQPLLAMLVFTLFFGRLAHIPSDGMAYAIFYYSALLPWMYFANSLQSATSKIVENQNVITKVYFPRLMLPLSAVAAGLVDFAVSFLMFIVLMVYYHVRPSSGLLFFPVFVILAFATALGAGLWFSALNAIYRDVRYVVPFLVQFWLFASPVAYPSSLVPAKWRWAYGLNPMAGVIEGFRWSLTGRGLMPGRMLLTSSVVTVLLLFSGLLYFQAMEMTIADVV
ncbi:MAG: ABC transporter permease [Acidobacteriota bacterium]|nr:ABC transporter permease [Acidobacteriota bacterium]